MPAGCFVSFMYNLARNSRESSGYKGKWIKKKEVRMYILTITLIFVFLHWQCTGLGKEEGYMNTQGIKCSSFNVFPTSVLVWMAWHSFSHISLICFVLFWIISVLLWPSFSSLDANSFKERTLECPRGLISFTKSLNFFSSTYRINRDTDIKFSASVKETERINSSVVCNTKVIHCRVLIT